MSQTIPATCVLGPGLTGLAIGVTVLNLDGTEYAAFSTSGVSETSVAGTYRKAGGVVCPDAGGYLVWGVSGADYAEATVDPVGLRPTVAGETVDVSGGAITTVTNLTNLPAAAALEATAQSILEDTGTTLPALISAGNTVGSGATSYPITVQDEDSNPIDGVEVWITTDIAGNNVIAGTLSTDALGVATFMLDAGNYYVWRQASGYNFTNPVAITVS